ncbi:MAG: glycosyltransferase family 4 protein, partial [Anaerolineales bacterium]
MSETSSLHHRPHLLIVSNDIVDLEMAGPGMRYLEMAKALRQDLEVTLAIPRETKMRVEGLRWVLYQEHQPDSLRPLVEEADVTLISGYMVARFPFLETTDARLVVDFYDPFALENIHYYLHEPRERQASLNRFAVETTNRLAKIGDYFLCGSERQRDFWMGVLLANGRVNPQTFEQDASLRSLIDVVGIGVPDRAPKHHRAILRGVHPQISEESRIVLWGGGIWNWLDPLTLVRAWPEVNIQYPEARLVFLGTKHPNPNVPVHEVVARTMSLAEEIGEKDRSILFFEWIPYEDREALLLEADVGTVLHPIHIETRYAIRTRVMDYFWARLPVLITEGDVTGEWVETYGLGRVVPPHDPQAVAEALCELLERPK